MTGISEVVLAQGSCPLTPMLTVRWRLQLESESVFTFMLAVGLSLSWGFLPEHGTLLTVWCLGSKREAGHGRCQVLKAWGPKLVWPPYRYSIGQAVLEPRFKER